VSPLRMLRGLTVSLSGRAQAHPARRERKIAKRARGAPPPTPHGPLQALVRVQLKRLTFRREQRETERGWFPRVEGRVPRRAEH
jgi:hypothetical protein